MRRADRHKSTLDLNRTNEPRSVRERALPLDTGDGVARGSLRATRSPRGPTAANVRIDPDGGTMQHDLTWENVKTGLRNPMLAFDQLVLEHLYRVPVVLVEDRLSIGTNVFSLDWDLLVLLDTCRVDALRAVADEYEFLEDVGTLTSVGASSPEWIARTFTEEYADEIENTAYLSANGNAETVLERDAPATDPGYLTHGLLDRFDYVHTDRLGRLEKLWTYEPVGEEGPHGHVEGATPPRYVTDRAIDLLRTESFDRTILHYHQPHNPYAARAMAEGRELHDYELHFRLDPARAWESYMDELRYVLDDVALLLENVDAERVVISSDHGEGFGECGVYGHPIGSLHPKIRTVPWAVTTATDEGTYVPETPPPSSSGSASDQSVDETLEALGYKF